VPLAKPAIRHPLSSVRVLAWLTQSVAAALFALSVLHFNPLRVVQHSTLHVYPAHPAIRPSINLRLAICLTTLFAYRSPFAIRQRNMSLRHLR